MSDTTVLGLMLLIVWVLLAVMGVLRRARHQAELEQWGKKYRRSGPQGPPRVVP